jgi:bifunctional non-homologous end joining protein LigD
MTSVALRRSHVPSVPAALEAGRRAPFPGFIEPCHPTLREAAPAGEEWLHEIKSDGYRAQVHVRGGKATIFSREGVNWTTQLAAIANAAMRLPVRDAILDGEAIVQAANGVADLQALRREIGKKHSKRLVYAAFDLLYLDGFDLREAPLIERKRLLRELTAEQAPAILYVEHIAGDGEAVYRHACRIGVEGIVSKHRDAPYRSGRQESWIKLKCIKSDTFPIVAFVEKLGAKPRRIASLYVGRRDGGRLLYAGKVRSGYTDRAARELRERLDPLILPQSPLSVPVRKPKATWVRPDVQAEIQFGGVTEEGLLREAVFKGMRDDLVPAVRGPRIVPATRPLRPVKPAHIGVPRENILQLLPDAVVPSKEELARYWAKVCQEALVYLGRRPLKLVRHSHHTTFYHKGPLPPLPASVHQLRIEKREGGAGVRLWVDSLDGLLGLVAIGAVELHPWAAAVDDIERADYVVFDLDPGDGIEWEFVVETAFKMREALASEGLKSWPKTTGGKGLHVVAPLARKLAHDAAHAFAKRLAERIAATAPERYVTSAALAKRPGRLFIDYLRNGRGTTAIGAYSPRARPGFPIARPVTWPQVERGIASVAFTMARPSRPLPVRAAPSGIGGP